MYITRIEENLMITIPDEIAEKLGLKIGDQLRITLENDGIVLTPVKTLITVSVEEFEKNFDGYFDQVVSGKPIIVTTDKGNAVMIPVARFEELLEKHKLFNESSDIWNDMNEIMKKYEIKT